MIYLVPIWLAFGLVSVLDVYFRAGRPFRMGESVIFLLGGPVFWGCLAILFVGGHLISRRTCASTIDPEAHSYHSEDFETILPVSRYSATSKRSGSLAA